MAAKEIEEVKRYKEELERQNREMETILGASGSERAVEKAEIKLRVDYPASGIDSMLAVLRCLRDTGSTVTAIQSTFSDHEFSATLEVHTKVLSLSQQFSSHHIFSPRIMLFSFNLLFFADKSSLC